MNKKEIDEYFVEIIPMLSTIIEGIKFKKNKSHLTKDTVINETYLHLFKNKDKINNTIELEKMAVNFIKMNIQWANSKINKMERVNNLEDFYHTDDTEDDFSVNQTITKNVPIDEHDEELNEKIELEKWYNNKKCILSLYRNSEENKLKQIIFDCYFHKNLTTGVALAKHLGVHNNYSCRYLRELKKDILEFSKNLENNNINNTFHHKK